MKIKNKSIVLTGGSGFLGKRVLNKLISSGADPDRIFVPRSSEYNLSDKQACESVVNGADIVIHLAAKVGGLWSHVNRQADFFYENACMGLHLVDASYRAGVKKFVGLGSVCEYPDDVAIPFKESTLWDGYPSKITAPYGLAKKMMHVASDAYSSQYGFNAIHLLMINLYGPGDDFNPETSHAIPALIRRVHNAKNNNLESIDVWGDGTASREFLFVDDAAEAIVMATQSHNSSDPVNIGSGREVPIKILIELICEYMNYQGKIKWDSRRVGGQLRRKLDVNLAESSFGFKAKTEFEDGLKETIDWYLSTQVK